MAAQGHATAQESFKKAGLQPGAHEFVTQDCFAFLERAAAEKKRFDIVISDPPSFAPNEKSVPRAMSAYRALHKACMGVLAPGGVFCAGSCSSHVDAEMFATTLDDVALDRGDLRLVAMHGQAVRSPDAGGKGGSLPEVRDFGVTLPILTLLRNDLTLLRHDLTLLRHDRTLLRHDSTLLRHDLTLLRHDSTLLRHDSDAPPSRLDAPPSRPDAPPSRPDAPPSRPDAPPSRPNAPPSRPDAPPSRPNAPPSRPDAPPSRPDAPPSRPDAPP